MNAQKCLRWFLFQRFYFPRIFVGVAESVQGFPLKPLRSACSFWYLATDYCCQKKKAFHLSANPHCNVVLGLPFREECCPRWNVLSVYSPAQSVVCTSHLSNATPVHFFWNGFKMCQGRVRHRYGFYLMFALSCLYVFFLSAFPFFIPAKVYPSLSLLVGFFLFAFLFTFFLFLLCR